MTDAQYIRRLQRTLSRVVVLRRLLREAEIELRAILKDVTGPREARSE